MPNLLAKSFIGKKLFKYLTGNALAKSQKGYRLVKSLTGNKSDKLITSNKLFLIDNKLNNSLTDNKLYKYLMVNRFDKSLTGNKLGYVSTAGKASMTGGLVQEFEHAVLPSITPPITFIATLLSIIVSSVKFTCWYGYGMNKKVIRALTIM